MAKEHDPVVVLEISTVKVLAEAMEVVEKQARLITGEDSPRTQQLAYARHYLLKALDKATSRPLGASPSRLQDMEARRDAAFVVIRNAWEEV